MDIDNIDIANHEFTGEELGQLLLTSVKQMKKGEVAKTYHIDIDIDQTVNEATKATQQPQALLALR